MKVSAWAVEKLTPYKGNPRKNEAAVEKVAASIKGFRFRVPTIVDEDGVIISEHTRLLATFRWDQAAGKKVKREALKRAAS